MNKMQIFEPAMCCSTGLCGVSVDPELLRISTVLDTLNKNGITVERYNLSNTPQAFVENTMVNTFIKNSGVEGLPAIVFNDEIIINGRYPSNEEFTELFHLSSEVLGDNKPSSCGCNGGCCC